MNDEPERQDADVVREFFNQWALYRKVVDEDYLFHREAMAALAGWMDRRSVGSFLDLGCGDASFTTGVLAGRGLKKYRAVDLSPVALDLARRNAAKLGCECAFTCGDFSEEVDRVGEVFDVVYIGLSLHHLPRERKAEFFRSVVPCVEAGGSFVFFEPTRRADESREAYLERFVGLVRTEWTALSPGEMDGVVGHVTTCDFPENFETYRSMAADAGFGAGELIFQDVSELYTMVAFSRT